MLRFYGVVGAAGKYKLLAAWKEVDGITEVGRTIQRTQMLDIPTNGNIAYNGEEVTVILKADGSEAVWEP